MAKQKFLLLTFIFFIIMTVSCQTTPQTYTIETNLGKIQVKLYDKTPLHKANFEKLVSEQFYDSVMFHRIIAGFMIQTGNPGTKPSADRDSLFNKFNYTIEAEFVPEYFHKKGALAAARLGDAVNPEKSSSSTQFYIVQGRTFSDEELNQYEERMKVEFSEFQRGIYKILGGTPFLDQNYTVFGEVVKGLDVVDAIASVPTGQADFPQYDVRILRIVKDKE